jgi:Flp pilus assembly protein TadG
LQHARRRARTERGQALLEIAFVLPLIIVFIMLLVDFGIAIDRRQVIQHAVREGARYGAVGAGITDIKQRVVDQSQGLLELTGVEVCYTDAPGGNGIPGNAGDSVVVTATFTHSFNVGSGEMLSFWGVLSAPTITMTPSADMRLESSVSPAPACP